MAPPWRGRWPMPRLVARGCRGAGDGTGPRSPTTDRHPSSRSSSDNTKQRPEAVEVEIPAAAVVLGVARLLLRAPGHVLEPCLGDPEPGLRRPHRRQGELDEDRVLRSRRFAGGMTPAKGEPVG